jgi:streptomycin 6-kinase
MWMPAGVARQLGARAGDRLVHADLHYGNVLAGDREPWLAIDPRAVAGDPGTTAAGWGNPGLDEASRRSLS